MYKGHFLIPKMKPKNYTKPQKQIPLRRILHCLNTVNQSLHDQQNLKVSLVMSLIGYGVEQTKDDKLSKVATMSISSGT